MLEEYIHTPRVAYFSMEIALQNDIPTYAGGLGVLAGDMVRSASDLMLPMVAVCLISRAGYFRQKLDADGRQTEQPHFWQPQAWSTLLDAKVAVNIEGRSVWVGAWLYVVEGHIGGKQPVLLLDTDFDENLAEDRELTHYLYGGNQDYRLKQEIILGIGGVRLLHALGFSILHYHMNEGHSALLGVELLHRFAYRQEELRQGEPRYDVPRVREMCSFTTHTPVEAGHDHFPYALVNRIFDHRYDLAQIQALGGLDDLNMTRLALNLSEYINGVANSHAAVSSKMFPGYRVHAITNGVHPYTWTAADFSMLYDTYIPGWCHEPELLNRVECCISDSDIRNAHAQSKLKLIDFLQSSTGVKLDPNIAIIGFARRMTAYKRPEMLFSDMERLKGISRRYPMQIVISGKAHPSDQEGKALIYQLHQLAKQLEGIIPTVYIADYDMVIAKSLISGSDIWLNTPLRPYEASGTSGMKAAFNGVPSLSVLDGWWAEGCIEGVTGWAIEDENGCDAEALYDKLEAVVLPTFYHQDATLWTRIMKSTISKNASYFNSHRMMRRYQIEAYRK